jgi:hypothetical protein
VTLRRVAVAIAVVTLLTSGAYVFVYLYRWEWNRAVVSGVIFLAAEVALVSAVITARLGRVDRRLDALTQVEAERLRRQLHDHQPPNRVSFAWLARTDRTTVFIPVLMGAGVVLTGVAWVVERVARFTARPLGEQRLTGQLLDLELPRHGFLDQGDDPLDLVRGPLGGPGA